MKKIFLRKLATILLAVLSFCFIHNIAAAEDFYYEENSTVDCHEENSESLGCCLDGEILLKKDDLVLKALVLPVLVGADVQKTLVWGEKPILKKVPDKLQNHLKSVVKRE